METEKLYINNENLGTETYVGTYDEFKEELSDIMTEWYRDYLLIYAVSEDPSKGELMSYTEYEAKTLNDGLSVADPDDIRAYDRITDIVPHDF